MSQRKIRLGLIGGGFNSFIGVVHRVAAYMFEDYEIVGGVFDVDFAESKRFAEHLELDVSRTYEDIDKFITAEKASPEDQRIEAVSVLTPNFLHYSMAKKLIEAGFHVICEKPITITATEAIELEELVGKHQVVFALTHTYTGYPMARQMKQMIADGAIGKVQKVDAQYYQGWINPIIHDKEQRKAVWRLDPKKSGQSSCFGDIGVHAFNMIEYATGIEVASVLADLDTLYDDNPLDVDGTALVRLANGAKGLVRASQIATGEENNITIAVYGDKGGLKWVQEDPTYLTYFQNDKPVQIYKPGHPYATDFAKESTKIAPGHPEGLFDAMGNIYKGASLAIRNKPFKEGAFPTVRDGVRGMKFIEGVLESHRNGQVWVNIQ